MKTANCPDCNRVLATRLNDTDLKLGYIDLILSHKWVEKRCEYENHKTRNQLRFRLKRAKRRWVGLSFPLINWINFYLLGSAERKWLTK